MLSPLDRVLLHTGKPGRYQVFIGFLLCCLQLPITFTGHLLTFYAEEPPHRCIATANLSLGIGESDLRPLINKKGVESYSSCSIYVDPTRHWRGTQRCLQGWEYRPSNGEWGVVQEWNLVCERKFLAQIIPYAFHGSAIIGGLLLCTLGDHFERKMILLLAIFCHTSVAIGIYFVPTYIVFVICFCIQAFFMAGIQILSYLLLIESLSTPYQLKASVFIVAFWSLGTMLLPLATWAVKNWRHIQLALFAPGIVFIGYIWLIPQSSLWLLAEGMVHPAEKIMERFANFNDQPLPPSFRLYLQCTANNARATGVPMAQRHSFLRKFTSPSVRWYLLVQFYIWFSTILLIGVTKTQMLQVHENKYLNYFYQSLMELGTVILLYFVINRIGSRATQALLFSIVAVLCTGTVILRELALTPLLNETDNRREFYFVLLPTILSLIATHLSTVLQVSNWFHVTKIIPTGVRAVSLAVCLCWHHVGKMATPHLVSLEEHIARYVPLGICSALAVISAGLSLLFPNRWQFPLPNTMEEAENRFPPRRNTSRTGSTHKHFVSANGHGNHHLYDDDDEDNNSVKIAGNPNGFNIVERHENGTHYQNGSAVTLEADTLPSRDVRRMARRHSEHDDAVSRLTDLEEELTRAWDLNWKLYPRNGSDVSQRDFKTFAPKNERPNKFKVSNETDL